MWLRSQGWSEENLGGPQLLISSMSQRWGPPTSGPGGCTRMNPSLSQLQLPSSVPRAEKVLAEMKSVKRLDELGQLIANLRGSLTMLKENATANDDGQ